MRLWAAAFSKIRCGLVSGANQIRLPVIPSPRTLVAWSGAAAARRAQSARHRRVPGVGHATASRPGCVRIFLTPSGQAKNVPVAEPVEYQHEKFSCDGDFGDVRAASFADASSCRGQWSHLGLLDGLDCGRSQQGVALFGDPTAVDYNGDPVAE